MSQATGDTRPMPFRVLLDEAMKLTRRHFRQLYWPVALTTAGVYGLFGVVFAGSFGSMMNTDPEMLRPDHVLASMAAGCGAGVLMMGVVVFFWLAMMSASLDATARRPAIFGDHLRFWLRPGNWATILLSGLFILLGLFACVVPGLYLILAFAFVALIVYEEKLTGWAACQRSSALVRYNPQGNFLDVPIVKVFVLLFVGYVLSSGLSMVFQLPISILQQVMTFRELGAEATAPVLPTSFFVLQAVAMVLSAFTTTVVQLYQAFGLSLLYLDSRRRQEGSDLEAAIDALDGGALAGGTGVPLP